jgi:hypothetical protein
MLNAIPSYQSTPAAQNKKAKAGKSKSMPSHPPRKAAVKAKPTSVGPQHQIADTPKGDPLQTATSLHSPFRWEKSDILRLYEPPTEEEIPAQLGSRSRGHTKGPRYAWKEGPLQYLDRGLRLIVKVEVVNLKQGNQVNRNLTRVKLAASWGSHTCIAIGDGANKVLIAALKICLFQGYRRK